MSSLQEGKALVKCFPAGLKTSKLPSCQRRRHMARTWRPWLTASKSWGPTLQRAGFYRQSKWAWKRVPSSRWDCGLMDTLISTLWEPELITQYGLLDFWPTERVRWQWVLCKSLVCDNLLYSNRKGIQLWLGATTERIFNHIKCLFKSLLYSFLQKKNKLGNPSINPLNTSLLQA